MEKLPSFKKKKELLDKSTPSFQATINLVISYDPPANAIPNPNDPQAGDATVDAGEFFQFSVMPYKVDSSPLVCLIHAHPAFTAVPLDGGQESDGTLPAGGSPGTPLTPGQSGHLRQQVARAQSRHRLVNKPQDFQVS